MDKETKIPERCLFTLVELKKKGRQWTAKLELRNEFDEVITNQRIKMTYNTSLYVNELEEAEQAYQAAKYKNNNKLLDTEDAGSLQNEVKRTKERVDLLNKRLANVQETNKDFDFNAKVLSHKMKYKEETMMTEIVYHIDKKTIDWFDEFGMQLSHYVMMIQE